MKKLDGYKNYIFGAAWMLNGFLGTVLGSVPIPVSDMGPEAMIAFGFSWMLGRNAIKKGER